MQDRLVDIENRSQYQEKTPYLWAVQGGCSEDSAQYPLSSPNALRIGRAAGRNDPTPAPGRSSSVARAHRTARKRPPAALPADRARPADPTLESGAARAGRSRG